MTGATSEAARPFTVAVLSEHWGVSTTFIYEQIKAGRLRAFKLGNKLIRIPAEAVAAYAAAAQLDGLPGVPAPAVLAHSAVATKARLLRQAHSPR